MDEVADFPGWYMDAVESNLAGVVDLVKTGGTSTNALYQMLLDRGELDEEAHKKVLALTLAITIRRIAYL